MCQKILHVQTGKRSHITLFQKRLPRNEPDTSYKNDTIDYDLENSYSESDIFDDSIIKH